MAGKKKPKFEYVEALQSYRKRIKDSTGKYVSIYGQTPAELEEKLVAFTQAMPEKEDNPLVNPSRCAGTPEPGADRPDGRRQSARWSVP